MAKPVLRDGGESKAREFPVYSALEWTPNLVRGAIADADNGQLMGAADLCEALLTDDRISGVTQTSTLALLGKPLIFEGEGAAVEALRGSDDVDGDWWRLYPEQELAKLSVMGRILGVGLAEICPRHERDASGRETPQIKVWNSRWLRFDWSNQQWFLSTTEGSIPITPGDGHWILYTPYGEKRPWAYGAWRALVFPWLAKQFALRGWQRSNEVYGSPMRIAKAPAGAAERMRRLFAQDLKALGRDTAMCLPDGYSFEVVEASAKTWDTFEHSIQWANDAIAVTLVGQIVTTNGTAGFSDGDTGDRIRTELMSFAAETLSSTIHDQALASWASINFGSSQIAPWVSWDTSPPEDQNATVLTMGAIGDAIAKLDAALSASGQRVDGAALAQKFDIVTIDLPVNNSQSPTIALAPTDIAQIIKVNEGRASAGLGPLLLPSGAPDPDGNLSIQAYKSKTSNALMPPSPTAGPRPAVEDYSAVLP